MSTETESQEVTEYPVAVDETSAVVGRLRFTLGRTIDQVTADALVCPQVGTFTGIGKPSLERELLEIKFGNGPFEAAEKAEKKFIEDQKSINVKGEIRIPPGYSVATPLEESSSTVKKIIHTNIAEAGGVSDVVRLAIGNSLEAAESDPNIKTVAIPLFGEITPDTLRPRILSIMKGVEDYFREKPDSTIREVKLVINTDNNETNRSVIDSILSSGA